MLGVEFLGEKNGGRLEDLDRALLIGHLVAQPRDFRELLSRWTDLKACIPAGLPDPVAQCLW